MQTNLRDRKQISGCLGMRMEQKIMNYKGSQGN